MILITALILLLLASSILAIYFYRHGLRLEDRLENICEKYNAYMNTKRTDIFKLIEEMASEARKGLYGD